MSQIPSVDLRDFLAEDPKQKARFVAEIGGAFGGEFIAIFRAIF